MSAADAKSPTKAPSPLTTSPKKKDAYCDHQFQFGRCRLCKKTFKQMRIPAPEGGIALDCFGCGYEWVRPEGENIGDPCPKCKGPIDHTLYVDASEYERAAKKAKADWIRQKTEAANKTIAETGDRTCDHRFKFGRCYKCGFSEAIYRREIVVERLEAKKHPKKKIVLLAPEGGVSLECVQCGYLWQRPEGERMDKPCPKCLTPVDAKFSMSITELVHDAAKKEAIHKKTKLLNEAIKATGDPNCQHKFKFGTCTICQMSEAYYLSEVMEARRKAQLSANKFVQAYAPHGGIVMICNTCTYKWKRPEGEPMSKPCPKCQTPPSTFIRESTTEKLAKDSHKAEIKAQTKIKSQKISRAGDPFCKHKFKFGICILCSMSESQYLVNLKAERKAKREKRTLDTEVAPPGGIVLLCHQCNYKWKRPEGEPMSKPCPKCQTPIRRNNKNKNASFLVKERTRLRKQRSLMKMPCPPHVFKFGKCSKCGAEDGLTHLEMKEAKAEAAMKKQLARTLSRPSFLPIVDIGDNESKAPLTSPFKSPPIEEGQEDVVLPRLDT